MQDNEPINLTYGQMSDMVNRIEQIPPLKGEGAPTSDMPAFHLGQTYIDTTTGDMYYCSGVVSESGDLPEYTWELVTDDIPEYTAGDGIDISEQDVISATNTGKAKVLTTADYNWPTTGTKTSVALWLLPDGIYYVPRDISTSATSMYAGPDSGFVLVAHNHYETSSKTRLDIFDVIGNQYTYTDNDDGTLSSGGSYVILGNMVTDNLVTSSSTRPLSAKQGKVLKDLIDSLIIKNAGAPTTSTVGSVGTLYEDTTNGKLYQCTAVSGNTYTWEEVGAGGSGGAVVELTSADYNYDYGSTGTNNCIALWLLSEGTYSWATTLRSSVRVTTTETAGDLSADGALVIAASDATLAKVYLYGDGSATTATGRNILQMYRVKKTNGTSNVSGAAITTRELKQSTGNSQTDVMSQNAVTSMVFADPATQQKIKIGAGASSSEGSNSIEIGHDVAATGNFAVAVGREAQAKATGSVVLGNDARTTNTANYCLALGHNSDATMRGEVSFGGIRLDGVGYNNSQYRLLTNVYDPQSAHDAATKGYVDPTTDSSAPTTATVGRLGQIQIDTTTATAYMCVAVDTVTPAYTWKQITA